MAGLFKLTAPVFDHSGPLGRVTFSQGEAVADEVEHEAEIEYARARGYRVERLTGSDPEPEPVEEVEPEGVELPKKSASAQVWRAYAVDSGAMTEDEAAAYSRDDLVTFFITEESK